MDTRPIKQQVLEMYRVFGGEADIREIAAHMLSRGTLAEIEAAAHDLAAADLIEHCDGFDRITDKGWRVLNAQALAECRLAVGDIVAYRGETATGEVKELPFAIRGEAYVTVYWHESRRFGSVRVVNLVKVATSRPVEKGERL
jgi:hypothetical protein